MRHLGVIDFDAASGFGIAPVFGETLNKATEMLDDVFRYFTDKSTLATPSPDTQKAVSYIKTLNTLALIELKAASPNRENAQIDEEIRQLTPDPGQFSVGPKEAVEKIKSFIRYIGQTKEAVDKNLLLPLTQAQYAQEKMNQHRLQLLQHHYEGLQNAIEASLQGRQGSDPAMADPRHPSYRSIRANR